MKFSWMIISLILIGCGVKGDPQPPLKPAHLGRGEPTFKDAVKEVKPAVIKENAEDEDDERQ